MWTLFEDDYLRGVHDAREALRIKGGAELDDLCCSVRNALVDMAFNLGGPKLRQFAKMLAALGQQDWETASAEAMDSAWFQQVGRRAHAHVETLHKGCWPAARWCKAPTASSTFTGLAAPKQQSTAARAFDWIKSELWEDSLAQELTTVRCKPRRLGLDGGALFARGHAAGHAGAAAQRPPQPRAARRRARRLSAHAGDRPQGNGRAQCQLC